MGVVIAPSKATAHVFRIFTALVVLLLAMALGVGLSRMHADQTAGSPYGALASLAPAPSQPPTLPQSVAASQVDPALVPSPLAAAAPSAGPVREPVADAPRPDMPHPATAVPAMTAIARATPLTTAAPTAPPASMPVDALAMTDVGKGGPRRIALDKAAAGSPIPQPAPPAVVAAATRVAAASVQPSDDSGLGSLESRGARDAARVASLRAGPPQADAEPRGASGRRVNINTASVDELNNLGAGHIGGTIARHRPYRSIEDLVAHRVLKARDFERIQAAIATN